MKILIVDDSKEMRTLITSFVKSDDTEIIELEDGDEAVDQYNSINPDWTLMDIRMKRMNGLEAAKQIKKKFPDAHIAIVSRYEDAAYKKYSLSVGAEVFISKQNLVELKDLLKKRNY